MRSFESPPYGHALPRRGPGLGWASHAAPCEEAESHCPSRQLEDLFGVKNPSAVGLTWPLTESCGGAGQRAPRKPPGEERVCGWGGKGENSPT